MQRAPCLTLVHEIALLGRQGAHAFGTVDALIAELKAAVPDATLVILDELDTFQARAYLSAHAADSLVVAPSLEDNFPISIIEATLIPGLNIICSHAGGQAEILGPGHMDQTFPCTPKGLADALIRWLGTGPRPASGLARYDWEAANLAWLGFHRDVARRAATLTPATRPLDSGSPMGHPPDLVLIMANTTQIPALLQTIHCVSGAERDSDVGSAATPAISVVCETPHSRLIEAALKGRDDATCTVRVITLSDAPESRTSCPPSSILGVSDMVCFLDVGSSSPADALTRLADCVRVAGLDAATCYTLPASVADEAIARPTLAEPVSAAVSTHTPLGPCLELGLFFNPAGAFPLVVRRSLLPDILPVICADVSASSFEQAWIIALSLTFAGHRVDVVPERLVVSSDRPEVMEMVAPADSHTPFVNSPSTHRALSLYRSQLGAVGLQQFIPWMNSMFWSAERAAWLKGALATLEDRAVQWEAVATNRLQYIRELDARLSEAYSSLAAGHNSVSVAARNAISAVRNSAGSLARRILRRVAR